MRNILKLSLVLFICSFAASCQKDFENTLDPVIPPVVTPHDSVTRLSRIFFIDYRVSDTDTMGYEEYTYDSLKRVTTIIGYFPGSGSAARGEVATYFYNGNDSMAYKLVYEETDPIQPSTEIYYFFYDNLKRLIKDSAIYSSTQTEVIQYTYSATTISGISGFINTANPLENSVLKDTGLIGNTGDVIKTNESFSHLNTGYIEYYITTFTYDNKPNPFYQLNIRSTYNPLPGADFYLESFYLQKNNPISSTGQQLLVPGSPSTDIYTYTYNTLGLPASVDVAFGGGTTDDYRLVFVYKKI